MAEFDLLSEYGDESALRKQTDFILALFKEIEDAGEAMGSKLKGFTTVFDNRNTGTKQFADGIKDIEISTSNYQKILAAIVPELDKLTQTQKEQLKSINDLYVANEKSRAGAKETVKLIQNDIALQVKLGAGNEALAKTIALNKEQLRQENLERTRLARVLVSENNSRQKAQAIIDLLINKGKKLNTETEQGARVNEAYNRTIERQRDFLLSTADVETKRIKNIGNYQGSAKIIVDAIEKEKKKLEELLETRIRVQNAGSTFSPGSTSFAARTTVTGFAGGGASPSVIAAQANAGTISLKQLDRQIEESRTVIEGFSRVTENPKFLNIAGKVGDVRAEILYFTNQLATLREEGLHNTEVYRQTTERLAELKKVMRETTEEVKALSSEHRNIDIFSSGVETLAASFELVAGSQALFGESNEHVEETIKRLVAIQTLSNGVKEISKQLTEKGTAANIAYSFVQKQMNVIMTQGIFTANGLNAALKLTGIGLAITAIVFLVTKLGDFGEATKHAKEDADKLAEAITKQREELDKLNDSLDDNVKLRSARLKGEGAADITIFTQQLNVKKEQLKNIEDEEKSNALKRLKNQNEIYALETKLIKGVGYLQRTQIEEQKKILQDLDISYANNAIELAESKNKKILDINLSQVEFLNKIAEDDAAKQKKIKEDANKAAEQRLKESIESEKRKQAAINQLTKDNIAEQIRLNQRIANSEDETLDDRIKAQTDIFKAQKALAAIQYQESIADEKTVENGKILIKKKSHEEKLLAENVYFNKINELTDEANDKNAAIIKAFYDKQKEELKKRQDEELQLIVDDKEKTKAEIDLKYAADVDNLNKQLEKKKISNEQYTKQRSRLEEEYHIASLTAEINYTRKILELMKLRGVDVSKELQALASLEIQLSDAVKNRVVANEEEKENATLKFLEKAKGYYSQLASIVSSAIDASVTAEKNRLQAQLDKIEAEKNAQLAANEAKTQSDQDRADNTAKINARAQAQKEVIERKQRQAEIRKAQFDKAAALFTIAIDTSIAVIRALGDKVLPYPARLAASIFTGVLGAAQLAIAAATPLPRFKDGLDHDYEGWAYTGDGGKSEAHIHKDGSVTITPDKDTLTYIEKGDRIHPDANTFLSTMQGAAMSDTARLAGKKITEENYGEAMIHALEKQALLEAENHNLLKQIANKKEAHYNASRAGMMNLLKWGSNETKYVEHNTNWN